MTSADSIFPSYYFVFMASFKFLLLSFSILKTHLHTNAISTKTINPKQLTPIVVIISKSSMWKGIPFRCDASIYSQFGWRVS